MAEVLVLAEHAADGEVKKVTLELLTAARRLGEPSVVWTGPDAQAAQPRLAEYGAQKVYVADSADYPVASAAELLASLVAEKVSWSSPRSLPRPPPWEQPRAPGQPVGRGRRPPRDWITELDFEIPVIDGPIDDDIEYLYWVGCAVALEDRAKKATKAIAELLDTAGVKFAVLGPARPAPGTRPAGWATSSCSRCSPSRTWRRSTRPGSKRSSRRARTASKRSPGSTRSSAGTTRSSTTPSS
jgi:hypothetical protein